MGFCSCAWAIPALIGSVRMACGWRVASAHPNPHRLDPSRVRVQLAHALGGVA